MNLYSVIFATDSTIGFITIKSHFRIICLELFSIRIESSRKSKCNPSEVLMVQKSQTTTWDGAKIPWVCGMLTSQWKF